jgi:predicted AAA+ superfamily ATPase
MGQREDFLDLVLEGDPEPLAGRRSSWSRQDYLEMLCAGSYPEPMRREGRRRNAWFDNYLDRIVSRDAHDVSRLLHLDRLPAVVRLLAANNSGELVKARIAKGSEIPESSVVSYIDLLATLYLIHVLPAWGNNLTKRVTGRPKVVLLDAGLGARLINVTPAAMTPGVVSDQAAGLFEAFVVAELCRQRVWSQTRPDLFHFRDRDGLEVDIVLEDGNRNVAGIEVKAAATVTTADFRGLAFLRDKLGHRFRIGVLFYTGGEPLPFGDRLWALPYSALWT